MVIYGIGGMFGMYVGGEWASRRAGNNERLQLKAMAIIYCVYAVLSIFIYLSPNHYFAFAMMSLGSVVSSLTVGPLFATIQTLVPPRMRAMSIAIIYLFANLIGLGLGPLAVGALSDALRPLVGVESLRYALMALCPGYCWVAWHLWRAGENVTRDLAAVNEETSTVALTSSTGESLEDGCPNQAA
jgi:MFS family permease